MINEKELQNHLASTHKKNALTGNLKELVYGGIDGIVTTFAVVAGFVGATMVTSNDDGQGMTISVTVVLIFGLANLFADGFSMGVGDFLSSRAENKLFEKERQKEISAINDEETFNFEYDETVFLLREKGFNKEDAHALTDIYKKNSNFWVEFMMFYELDMPKPEESPVRSAVVTFVSFVVFGLMPLLPYIFDISIFGEPFGTAIVFVAIALVILGIVRAQFTKENMLISVAEIVGLGMSAALIAYFVGTLFT